MLYGKLYVTRRRGRPKMRWLDDVSMDLRTMGLTFKNHASYIYRTGIPLPSRCSILYIFFNKYKYWAF
jgi:hypothetical protein